jgi:alpha-ketoglutarate-dependent taurine dioxygenase
MNGIAPLAATGPVDEWIDVHHSEVRESLLAHGIVRVTGAPIAGAPGLARARDALRLRPAPARELFAPRQDLGDGVYTAPDWAPEREMCHHHEQAYGVTPPAYLLLACLRPPSTGGALLVADTARVLEHIPSALAERFAAHGWLLTRAYRPYLGLPWATALGVDSREAASAWLEANGIHHSWETDGSLGTRQVRPAVRKHHATGEPCWFNDVAFFNQWAVARAERDVLLKTFGPQGMPFNTFAGDGTPLSEPEFQSIVDAYDAVGERLALVPGELLILDNVRMAHGREPYTGLLDLAAAPASSWDA